MLQSFRFKIRIIHLICSIREKNGIQTTFAVQLIKFKSQLEAW